jgi:Leucine-rich repeat (LRR) protein
LREVVANQCKVAEFPASLKQARGLRSLSLSGNVISSLPDDALQGIIHTSSNNAALSVLYRVRVYCQVRLPETFGAVGLPTSTSYILCIRDGETEEVGILIAGFAALTLLDLSRNSLTTLPSNALAGCSSLVSLSISNNRLKVCMRYPHECSLEVSPVVFLYPCCVAGC